MSSAEHGSSSTRNTAPLGLELARVAGGDDVALNGFHGLGFGHSLSHYSFKEIACGPIAVVAADTEDDGAFLLHGLIALGKRDDPGGSQRSGLSVALIDRVGVLAIAGAHVVDEDSTRWDFE